MIQKHTQISPAQRVLYSITANGKSFVENDQFLRGGGNAIYTTGFAVVFFRRKSNRAHNLRSSYPQVIINMIAGQGEKSKYYALFSNNIENFGTIKENMKDCRQIFGLECLF